MEFLNESFTETLTRWTAGAAGLRLLFESVMLARSVVTHCLFHCGLVGNCSTAHFKRFVSWGQTYAETMAACFS